MIQYCDSQTTVTYTKIPLCHIKIKYCDIMYNFIRDILESGEINLQYNLTRKMIANPFTKPIAIDLFEKHVKALSLRRI